MSPRDPLMPHATCRDCARSLILHTSRSAARRTPTAWRYGSSVALLYIAGNRFNGIRVTWVTRRPDIVSRISRIHVRGRGRRTLCSLLSLKKEVTVLAEAKGTRRVTNRHAIACGSNACASARCGRQAALLALRSRTHSPRACAKRMRARRRGRSVAECSRRSALLMLPPSGVRMLPPSAAR